MFQKANAYYADWRDRKGKRHRKAFKNRIEAENYEAQQKDEVHPKSSGAARRSQPSSPRTSRQRTRTTTVKKSATRASQSSKHSRR